jgi:hypothetical protein
MGEQHSVAGLRIAVAGQGVEPNNRFIVAHSRVALAPASSTRSPRRAKTPVRRTHGKLGLRQVALQRSASEHFSFGPSGLANRHIR